MAFLFLHSQLHSFALHFVEQCVQVSLILVQLLLEAASSRSSQKVQALINKGLLGFCENSILKNSSLVVTYSKQVFLPNFYSLKLPSP